LGNNGAPPSAGILVESAEMFGCVAFFTLGVCLFVFGTYSVIVGLAKSARHGLFRQ
jgi:hypothetical protein